MTGLVRWEALDQKYTALVGDAVHAETIGRAEHLLTALKNDERELPTNKCEQKRGHIRMVLQYKSSLFF